MIIKPSAELDNSGYVLVCFLNNSDDHNLSHLLALSVYKRAIDVN